MCIHEIWAYYSKHKLCDDIIFVCPIFITLSVSLLRMIKFASTVSSWVRDGQRCNLSWHEHSFLIETRFETKSRPWRWKPRVGPDSMVAHTFSQISPNWTSARRCGVEIVACSSRSIDRSFSRAVRVWSSGSGVFFYPTFPPPW